MSTHMATTVWLRSAGEAFRDNKYSRAHLWKFDGGSTVAASSSPHNVKLPLSREENVDPEEALVAAVSSCHLLTFLHLAASAGLVVDSYEDTAVGYMGEFEKGKPAVTKVVLRPRIVFSGETDPGDEMVGRLHHESHEKCFIANSVRTEIEVQGTWSRAGSR